MADADAFARREALASFHPAYTNQVFGDGEQPETLETIRGYKGLEVDVWLHATTMTAYAEMRYKAKATLGRRPDDVLKLLAEPFGGTLMTDATAYGAALGQAVVATAAVGRLRAVSRWEGGAVLLAPRGHPLLKMVVGPTQPVLFFFIDGASIIELDDKWEVLLLLDGSRLAGLATLYNYYAWPDRTRLRLSQMLVLPPYQRKGYGTRLIEAINALAVERDCLDLTVEDPTEEMQRLRDVADLRRVRALEGAMDAAKQAAAEAFAADMPPADPKAKRVLPHRAPHALVDKARAQLKICPAQMARLWEAMLVAHADAADPKVVARCRARLHLRLEIQFLGAKRSECVDDASLKRIVDLPFRAGVTPEDGMEPDFVMAKGLPAPQPAAVEGSQGGEAGPSDCGEAAEAAETAGTVKLEEEEEEAKRANEEATREALDGLCQEEEAAMLRLVAVLRK